MRLIFLDESGVSSFKDSRYVMVAGVIVEPDRQYRLLETAMLHLVAKHIPEDKADHYLGFHATELFNGGGKIFKDWPIEKTLPIIRGILRAIKLHSLPIVYGCSDRVHYRTAGNRLSGESDVESAYMSAFMQVLVRANAWMREKARPEELAILIVEDNEKIRARLRRIQIYLRSPSLEDIRIFGEQFTLDRIIESVVFQPKGESHVLPLADMCAYVLNRKAGNKRIDGLFDWIATEIVNLIPLDPSNFDPIRDAIKTRRRFNFRWGY